MLILNLRGRMQSLSDTTQIAKQIDDIITVISNRFGNIGTDVWDILVKGQIAYGWFSVIIFIAVLAICYFSYKPIVKAYSSNDDVVLGLRLAAEAILIVMLIIAAINLVLEFPGIFIPEHEVLHSLMRGSK